MPDHWDLVNLQNICSLHGVLGASEPSTGSTVPIDTSS